MSVTPLVLAAGQGTRFGPSSKLLADLGGKPVLTWVFESLKAAGLVQGLVALPDDARKEALLVLVPEGFEPVFLPQNEVGMGLSIAALAKRLPAGQDALVVLGDQPLLAASDLEKLMEQPSVSIRRLGFKGKSGHPVLFPAALVPLLCDLEGDEGGRALIKQHGCDVVEVDDPLVLCDVDTPDALEALRSRV